MEDNFLEIARSVSGYRSNDMADIVGLDHPSYRELERYPDGLSLRMIGRLLPYVNRHSAQIIHDAVDDIFLPYE